MNQAVGSIDGILNDLLVAILLLSMHKHIHVSVKGDCWIRTFDLPS